MDAAANAPPSAWWPATRRPIRSSEPGAASIGDGRRASHAAPAAPCRQHDQTEAGGRVGRDTAAHVQQLQGGTGDGCDRSDSHHGRASRRGSVAEPTKRHDERREQEPGGEECGQHEPGLDGVGQQAAGGRGAGVPCAAAGARGREDHEPVTDDDEGEPPGRRPTLEDASPQPVGLDDEKLRGAASPLPCCRGGHRGAVEVDARGALMLIAERGVEAEQSVG